MIKTFLIFCFLPIVIFGQTNSVFTYSITVVENKDSKMMEMMEAISPNYSDKVGTVEFTLISDTNKSSCFSINKQSIPDDDGVKLFLTMTEYTGQINQDNGFQYKEYEQEYLGKKFIVKDTINTFWKMTNDSKEIMGYKCFKATCEKVVVNAAGTFKNDIIAWFCPQLPYQFGPMGYGQLPGLIFELQTKYALFGLKKMELKTQALVCEPNEKSNIINAKDFEQIVLKSIENKRALMRN